MSHTVPVSTAKQQLGALVDRAHLTHETVFISKHGKRVAALVDAEAFERMRERLEDIDDAAAANEARRVMAESGSTSIPWEEVKADLGLA
jgi:prevent-host-death family protein